ncbi:DUF1742-domain-containing protein [Piedraia hortae CBS 480.64]|uniref:DUF1742-domain-containing protein n=1 Tax=Piedraia hortae CBS 480.64 TaxID=1314780 RepID=A0A6A7C9F0_9PEZI|nr:DUF1742-domain-containing protein [Piedraia hortae CBS 480.64]
MATNIYHRRLVAEPAAKACWICYKPSSTVLTTPGGEDFFYICPGHLDDTKFALAKDSQQPHVQAEKGKNDDKTMGKNEKVKDEDTDVKDSDKQPAKKKTDRAEPKTKDEDQVKPKPRVFELQKSFWQMRLQQKREAELRRRNRERMASPNFFPTVPKGNPSG